LNLANENVQFHGDAWILYKEIFMSFLTGWMFICTVCLSMVLLPACRVEAKREFGALHVICGNAEAAPATVSGELLSIHGH